MDERRSHLSGTANSSWTVTPSNSDLCPQITREVARCRYHACLNLDLRRLPVQFAEQAVHIGNHRWNIGDDQPIRALIGNDVAPLREELFDCRHYVFGSGIAQIPRNCRFVHGQRLCLNCRATRVCLTLDRAWQCDTQDVAFDLAFQSIVVEHDT